MQHDYNGSKCHVDRLDKMMTEYTCVRPFRNGRCIRRFVSNLWDFAINNAKVSFGRIISKEFIYIEKFWKVKMVPIFLSRKMGTIQKLETKFIKTISKVQHRCNKSLSKIEPFRK